MEKHTDAVTHIEKNHPRFPRVPGVERCPMTAVVNIFVSIFTGVAVTVTVHKMSLILDTLRQTPRICQPTSPHAASVLVCELA